MPDDPLILVAGGFGALLLMAVVVKLAIGGRGGAPTASGARVNKGVARALEDGDYGTAAMRAMQASDFETAYELFMRAQQPGRAALAAEKMGRLGVAAELYEKAGDLAKAAALYR